MLADTAAPSAVIQQPETDSGVIPGRAGNLFTLQLDAEKTGEEVRGIPPHFPILECRVVVSQAIFEHSLGSLLTRQCWAEISSQTILARSCAAGAATWFVMKLS